MHTKTWIIRRARLCDSPLSRRFGAAMPPLFTWTVEDLSTGEIRDVTCYSASMLDGMLPPTSLEFAAAG
jgi:hypothetical protein